jgi:hypothetical protein
MIARTHRTCAARSRYDHECARIFALAAFAASICAFASGPPSEPAIPRAELPETHGTSAGKGEISRRPIPFEAPRGRVIADAADVTAIRELGRSDAEARQSAYAIAMCEAWLGAQLPKGDSAQIDRRAFLSRMAQVKSSGNTTWSIEATASLIALATNESLARIPLTCEERAVRDAQRGRVREAVLDTVALIERKSGRPEFKALSELVVRDAEAGFNQLMETSWACVGQVPISSSLFEELMSGIEANRERAALAAATEMAAPVDLGEMPTIAAAAVADVLLDAVFDYGRSAFLDGFAGRGVPLRFYGFSGGISGRLSAVRIMPSGELPSPEHSHANELTP